MKLARIAMLWMAHGLAFLGLYELFVAKLSGQESIVGAAIAGVAAVATTAMVRATNARFRPRVSWLRVLVRVPWRVLADCGIVALAVGRRIRGRPVAGRFRTVPFDPGGDDPTSAARRALVTAGVSIAPNTYVVAIDRERRLLLVHQLVPSAEPPGRGDRMWPL